MKNKYYKLLYILLMTVIIITGCNNKSKMNTTENGSKNENLVTYTDKTFDFSLDFPEKWEYSINHNIEATKEIEATPDSGIEIYVNENRENRIYVFQQRGHISIPDPNDYEVESIKTSSGLNGDLYKRKTDNVVEIRCIIDEFIGVIVFMDYEIYDKNSEEIMNIIYSIRK
ncbi:MAG: hypothetical protein GX279_02700 [Clostridiaceae bacterium]|nr:hypothetical protein [Clostridiaceae bacterium]